MNLLTKSAFAKLCGVSPAAITKAGYKDKDGNARLECYKGTSKIDIDSPLSRAFRENIPDQRLNKVVTVPGEMVPTTESEDLTSAITKVQKAQAQKTIEEAGLKKEQRIERQMKNSVRRADLFESKKVEISLFMFIDRLLNTNKRYFSAAYDEIVRETLAKGEKVEGLKQKFLNEMEESADEAKTTVCDRLDKIGEEQARVN